MENNKSKLPILIFPMIILILIIIGTWTLYFYDDKYNKENIEITENTKKIDEDIKKIKSDENLQIFDIITNNKKIIDKLNSYSQVPRFIKWIEYIEKKYFLDLEWFTYSKGTITTSVEANYNKSLKTYNTTANFIEKYRKEENVDFELPFIKSVNSTWIQNKRNMKFNLKLKVKDKLPNIENDK